MATTTALRSATPSAQFVVFGSLFLVVTASSLLDAGQLDALAWQRGSIVDGQWWRLVTGHLVHSNSWHAALNGAGIAVVAIGFATTLSARTWLVIATASVLVIDVVLAARGWPDTYVGFSGVLHALFAAPLATLAAARTTWAAVPLAALWLKVVGEAIFGGSAATAELIGVQVATAAHFTGVAVGCVGGFVAGKLQRRG